MLIVFVQYLPFRDTVSDSSQHQLGAPSPLPYRTLSSDLVAVATNMSFSGLWKLSEASRIRLQKPAGTNVTSGLGARSAATHPDIRPTLKQDQQESPMHTQSQ